MNPSSLSVRDGAGIPGRHEGLVLGAILLLALALGLRGSDYALWYDEIASTRFAAQPWHRLWSDWMISETNPPLYYSLLKLWIGLVGDSDARIRLLSTLIGLAGIVCAWQLGRALAGPCGGIHAALLLAVSPQHIAYSQLARAYILGHSATLLALVGLARLAACAGEEAGDERRLALALYAAGAIVAVYSHTMLILVPLLANVWFVARLAGWGAPVVPGAVRGWIGANLAVLLAWVWWGRMTWLQMTAAGSNVDWIAQPSLPYAVRLTLESYVPWSLTPIGGLGAALFAGLFLWGGWRGRPGVAGACVVIAVGAPVLLFAIGWLHPVFLARTVYFAAGPFLVCVAAGLAGLPRRLGWAVLAGVLLLDGLAIARWYPEREVQPWRALAAALAADRSARVVVVQGVGNAFALDRYCAAPGCGKRLVVVPWPQADRWTEGMARPPLVDPARLADVLACGQRAAALRWGGSDPARFLRISAGQVGAEQVWGPGSALGLSIWAGRKTPAADCPAP